MTTPTTPSAMALRERVAYEIKCAAYHQPLMGVDWTRLENQRWLDVADRVIAQAVQAERDWWRQRFAEDTPCVAAGLPPCTHAHWSECVLYADAHRARPIEPC